MAGALRSGWWLQRALSGSRIFSADTLAPILLSSHVRTNRPSENSNPHEFDPKSSTTLDNNAKVKEYLKPKRLWLRRGQDSLIRISKLRELERELYTYNLRGRSH